jgi:hypothetical protein
MKEKDLDLCGTNICHICGRPGYKTDSDCKVWCEKCLGIEYEVEQYIRSTPKIQRNSLCSCGSGKKYKNCCLNKE